METASEKLQRIHHLWKELYRTQSNTSEYEALMEQIRVLSAEYEALIDAPQKPKAFKASK